MAHLSARMVLALSAAAMAFAARAAPESSGPRVASGLVESARVEVVEGWPFVVEGDAAACADLGPGDLRVTENGKEVEIVAVEPALPVTTHVLMLDTSGSMSDPTMIVTRRKGKQTRAAAKAYVRSMLADAPGGPAQGLLVFTFDDDLLMRNVRTLVTDLPSATRLEREIDRITGGFGTALNDSMVQVVLYLASLSERAVVILLSDGADTASVASATEVGLALKDTNNVTVFPIGIGLSKGPHQQFLETLAAISGGKYYWLRDARPADLGALLEKRFQDVRERVKSQHYVSWLPEPHDAASDRAVEPDGAVRRKVRIRSLDPRCKIPGDGYRPERSLAAATRGPAGKRASAPDVAQGKAVRIELGDILFDSGPLIHYSGEQELAAAVIKRREVEILLPPMVRSSGGGSPRPATRSPADVIHDWLLDGRIPSRPSLLPTPCELNGQAFLAQRHLVAQALFDNSSELRAWARDRFGERFRAEIAARTRRSTGVAPSEKDLDLVVEARLANLVPADYERDVAGWYRDVPARELAFDLECKEANLLLTSGEVGIGTVDRLQERWGSLHDWLHVPDRVRVLTPLEPIYDPSVGSLQFFRIVLPRIGDLPEDLDRASGKLAQPSTPEQWLRFEKVEVPTQPFGLLAVRWLLDLPLSSGAVPASASAERSGLARTLAAHWRVIAMAEEPQEAIGPMSCRRDLRIDLRELASTRDDADLGLRIVADFEEDSQRAGEQGAPRACSSAARLARIVPRCAALTGGRESARGLLSGMLTKAGLPQCDPEQTAQ